MIHGILGIAVDVEVAASEVNTGLPLGIRAEELSELRSYVVIGPEIGGQDG